jgi:hypothetical protein
MPDVPALMLWMIYCASYDEPLLLIMDYRMTHKSYTKTSTQYCDVLLGNTPVTEYTYATRELRMLFRVAGQRSARQAAGIATTAGKQRDDVTQQYWNTVSTQKAVVTPHATRHNT